MTGLLKFIKKRATKPINIVLQNELLPVLFEQQREKKNSQDIKRRSANLVLILKSGYLCRMGNRLLLSTVLLNQVSLHVLGLNLWNEKYLHQTEDVFWRNSLCGMCPGHQKGESPTEFSHLSLEGYFTNQSRKPWDFFASLSRHVNHNKACEYTVSLSSYSPSNVNPQTHEPAKFPLKIGSNFDTLGVRLLVLTVDSRDMIFSVSSEWANKNRVLIFLVADVYHATSAKSNHTTLGGIMEDLLKRIWWEFRVYNIFITPVP